MAHRALTLKYRPQVFADLIGQDHVSLVLGRALENGRVAHAYLFTGARGVGKTTSARILAKALNCDRRRAGKQPGADPCNACHSCLEITSGVSLDVAEIDGASNRGIADVQALREKVRFAPTGGNYRVVIIDEVHQLSSDAFAALLKTLEEPPPHLVFIFATTDPQKLPDTIRSRTQRFDFARVPLRKVADRLLEIQKREAADPEGVKFTLGEKAALLLAHKSEGSMRDAVSALDQVVSAGENEISEELVRRVLGIADLEVFFRLGGAIFARDPAAALRAIHDAFAKGLDPRELADGLGEHVRHALILKVDPKGGDLVPLASEDLDRLRQASESWSESDLLRLLKLATDSTWPMRDSAQPLVHLEAAVLQMATLERGETLADILARLDTLEQRLGGSGAAGGRPATAPARGAPAPVAGGAPASAASKLSNIAGGRTPGGTGGAPGVPRAFAPSAAPAFVAPAAPAFAAPAMSTPARAAAPAPVSAPAIAALEDDALLADADSERLWQQALAAINGRKRMLGAILDHCRFLGVSAADIVIGMADLQRVMLDDKENRAIVAEEAQRAFGRPLVVRCVVGGDAVPAAKPPVLEDVKPLVDRAIAFFDGEIIDPRRAAKRTNPVRNDAS